MGPFPSGTVGIVACLGNLYLKVYRLFQKSLGLGEGGRYFQALRLEEQLKESTRSS